MNILVTGGAGYIGSHTCIALLKAGHSVIVIDNFNNSDRKMVDMIEKLSENKITFYEFDVTDNTKLNLVFKKHRIDGVIHFAGFKAVGESISKPLEYYYNNLVSTIVLMQACQKYSISKLVFSSSATVYGENEVPFKESMKLLPATNPYGQTKVMCERMLIDTFNAINNTGVSILRYFNPIGAHESGLIGEKSNGTPNNIMPYITQVAKGKISHLKIFGDDYPTIDGTGVRDYIHVMDLAEGHVAAVEQISEGVQIYNLGTGYGTSVLELIQTFEKANEVKVPYRIVDRRPGDIAVAYADVTKAKNELGWEAKRDLITMCRDAWRFEIKKGENC
ncbi:UDP-glucose 4-epimerase GalE [Paenibacillus septentrionalis]|uniref:UDP-glucose 4-epimerase n=2 Tax=Paenibacillus septentrionalis TaxID=429342 RepID=A0ABW1V8N2_9BACL